MTDYGPRDLCPFGHGPMWWWPTGGEWACQLPSCTSTKPVYAHQVNAFDERFWHAQRFTMNSATIPTGQRIKSIFRVSTT